MAQHLKVSTASANISYGLSICCALASLLCSSLAIWGTRAWNSEYESINQKLLSHPGSSGTWINHYYIYGKLIYGLPPIAGILSLVALIPTGRGRRPFLTLAVPAFLVSLYTMLPLFVAFLFLIGFTM